MPDCLEIKAAANQHPIRRSTPLPAPRPPCKSVARLLPARFCKSNARRPVRRLHSTYPIISPRRTGSNLTKAYMQIANAKIRRSIVNLVAPIAGPEVQ